MNVGELLKALVGLDHLTEVVIYDRDVPGIAVLFPFSAGVDFPPLDPKAPVLVIHGCRGPETHERDPKLDIDHDSA